MARKSKKKQSGPAQGQVQAPQAAPASRTASRSWHYILALAVLWGIFYSPILLGQANLWEDLVNQEFPHRLFARDCILGLQFPHWNPYTFGGMPFFAALHSGVLYPFNLLLSLVPAGQTTFWYLLQVMIVLHLLFGGMAMYYYVRGRRLTRESSFVAAIGYMLCGFAVTQVIHSLMLYIVAWLPLIVGLLERAQKRRRLDLAVVGGLILGLTIFAGHPQITFYEFLFLGCYSLYLWLDSRPRRAGDLLYPAVLFGVAVGLSLVQLLPAAELSGQSARVSWTFEAASEGSMSFRQLLSFLTPKVFGAWTGARTGAAGKIPPFWLQDSFHSGYYTYWETCFYTGIAVLLLAAVRLARSRTNRFALFCAVWCGASLTVALGNHFLVYWFLYKFVPGFGTFRIPARILFTWNFLLPVMAATTLEAALSREEGARERRRLLVGAGAIAVVGVLVGAGALKAFWTELQDARLAAFAARQGWLLVLNALVVGGIVLAIHKGTLDGTRARWAMAAALTLDLLVFGWGQHMVDDGGAPRVFGEQAQISRALHQEGKEEIFRANMRQFVLEPDVAINRKGGFMVLQKNQGPVDKIQLIEGYNPLQLYRRLPPIKGRELPKLLDLLNVKYFINPGYRPGPDNRSSPIAVNPNRLPRARFFYHARVFDNDSLVKEHMLAGDLDHRNELLLSEPLDIALPGDSAVSTGTATVTHYGINRIDLEVQTDANGLLWLSEIWYPAWRASVDGKPVSVLCTDYSFRAVEVPAGKHTVRFVYSSTSFKLGAAASLVTLLACAAALWFLRKRS